ncbi:hypothetical protein CITRIK5_70824 [Citricoccus sp. K5]|nr:hypothetical protein CITRIK5_70824 [Citricoccus sp. K5]
MRRPPRVRESHALIPIPPQAAWYTSQDLILDPWSPAGAVRVTEDHSQVPRAPMPRQGAAAL